MAQKVIKSDCIMCINSCGIDAYVEDGKLVKVEGMKEHAVSEGYLCPRGEALVEYVYSPDRIQFLFGFCPHRNSSPGYNGRSFL